jgi:hypothetical protein
MMDKMEYCELWLEMKGRDNNFRVVLLAPKGIELPEGYVTDSTKRILHGRRLCYSEWFEGIHGAKESLEEAASFYREKEIKFLLFSEIRPPQE